MGEFYQVILCLGLCVFAFTALVNGFPAENEIRDTEPLVLGLVTKEIPTRVTSFSLDLMRKLVREKSEENVLYSPVCVYAALMMLHLGAGDKTRKELNGALKITGSEVDPDKLHEAFSEVLKKIERVFNSEDQMPETNIANGFFVQKDHPILESFLQSLNKHYNATATNVDFLEHADEATNKINSFISESTKNRIQKFYESSLPSSTVAVLANALHFHGIWQNPFIKEQTEVGKFHTGNSEIEVSMMHDQRVISYSRNDDLLVDTIELPYKGGEYSMVVVLPHPTQTVKNVTEHLHLYDLQKISQNTKVVAVDYKIPKMKFSWKNSLVNPLGLEEIFRSADLNRISAQKIPISEMLHASVIEVDEQGTVASAATAIGITRHLTPPVTPEHTFYVDRPFFFTLIHKPTHVTIFQGVIYKPQQ